MGGTGVSPVICDPSGNVGQLVAWAADYQGASGNAWHADRLVARYEYDPYGNVIGPDTDADGDFDEDDQPGPYAAVSPFRFSTKYYDGETESSMLKLTDDQFDRLTERDVYLGL